MIQSGSGKDLRASPPCPPPEPLCPSFPSEHRFHAWYRKSPEILHFRAFLSVFDLRSALAELSGGSENMPGPCFPERPQRLCREDAAVRQEIYLLENCRAEQKTCRGHVFPRDRSGYAARMPQCDKRIISWRTVGRNRKHAGGMFSRATAAAVPRGCRSATRDLSLGELRRTTGGLQTVLLTLQQENP